MMLLHMEGLSGQIISVNSIKGVVHTPHACKTLPLYKKATVPKDLEGFCRVVKRCVAHSDMDCRKCDRTGNHTWVIGVAMRSENGMDPSTVVYAQVLGRCLEAQLHHVMWLLQTCNGVLRIFDLEVLHGKPKMNFWASRLAENELSNVEWFSCEKPGVG